MNIAEDGINIFREARRVKQLLGYEPSILNPNSFNEKILWKKFFNRNNLLTVTADKVLVREYIKERLGADEAAKLLIPQIIVTDDPNVIPFDNLPQPYILKANHGSGWNIVVNNSRPVQKSDLIKLCTDWLNTTYGQEKYEWAYKHIIPKIIVEKLLLDENSSIPKDYKFFMFHGKCKLIQVDFDRFVDHSRTLYDENYNMLNIQLKFKQGPSIKRPANLSRAIAIAESLSDPFDFVRVDLYIIEDNIYFGELTHYPGSGAERFTPQQFDFALGEYWNTPKQTIDAESLVEKWLQLMEKKYGGFVKHIPRRKISRKDPRSINEILKGGMVGGDRMSDEHHGYAAHYAKYLLPKIQIKERVVLVELGVLKGTGLAIWSDLFPKGRIIGLDIDLSHLEENMGNLRSCEAFTNNNIEIYEFDQFDNNEKRLSEILGPDKIDIFIDDGCHFNDAILTTLRSAYPFLASDFVYFIEDNAVVAKEIEQAYPHLTIQSFGKLTILRNQPRFKKYDIPR